MSHPPGATTPRLVPLDPSRELRVELLPPTERDPEAAGEIDTAWENARARNPRLFDGPMLASDSIDAENAILHARRESYRRLAVADTVETGVRQLGVNAMLVSRESDGIERTLIGRRGASVRAYAGRWELAPAGGLEPAPGSPHALTHADVLTQLRREAEEELGIEIAPAWCRPLCVVRDFGEGRHDNIVVRVDIPPGAACVAGCRADAWEYPATAWITRAELTEFAQAQPDALIPPTLAVLRWAGWIEG